jgi:hypothetical protein
MDRRADHRRAVMEFKTIQVLPVKEVKPGFIQCGCGEYIPFKKGDLFAKCSKCGDMYSLMNLQPLGEIHRKTMGKGRVSN